MNNKKSILPICDYSVAEPGAFDYRRMNNSPIKRTEEKLNNMYGAWKTILCNSGMEAIATVLDLLEPATIITSHETYYETRGWMEYKKFDIKYIDFKEINTLSETLSASKKPILIVADNPSLYGDWLDIKGISQIAHTYGAYLMMDNSFVSLYFSNPIKEGADIVVESYTKYVCGHGDVFAGGIALAPSMKWLNDKEVPWQFKDEDFISCITSHRGNFVSVDTAYLIERGIGTLNIRMERHTSSAMKINDMLAQYGVTTFYAGVGGLILIKDYGYDFCIHLHKFVHAGTYGCAYSSVYDFSVDNIPYVHLSVGLEELDTLIADVKQALVETEKDSSIMEYLKQVENRSSILYTSYFRDYIKNGGHVILNDISELNRCSMETEIEKYFDLLRGNRDNLESIPIPFL